MIKRLITMALVGTLSACASTQRPDPSRVQEEYQEYCRIAFADVRIDPIRSKVPVNLRIADPIPVQMMANDEYPALEEKDAILAFATQRQNCIDRERELFGAAPAHFEAFRRINSAAIADLYSEKLTYGQFAQFLNQASAQVLQQDAELQRQNERDRAEAQRVFAQQLYQQQMIQLENRRLQSERRRTAEQAAEQARGVNCTTQRIGDQTYTNCR